MKVEDKNLSFLFLRALVSKQYEKVNNSKKKMAFMADALSEIITQNSFLQMAVVKMLLQAMIIQLIIKLYLRKK